MEGREREKVSRTRMVSRTHMWEAERIEGTTLAGLLVTWDVKSRREIVVSSRGTYISNECLSHFRDSLSVVSFSLRKRERT